MLDPGSWAGRGACLRPLLLPCPSSRPRNRVCRVHAACSLAGAGSADRRGGRGDVYTRRKAPRPLAVQIRDRLGQWLSDEEFASAFGDRGRPGWSPSRLALVTVLQRAEKLDRPAGSQRGPDEDRLEIPDGAAAG